MRLVNALEMTFILMAALPGISPQWSNESLRLDCVLTRYGCEAAEESAIIKYSYSSQLSFHWALNIFVRNPDVALG